MKVADINIMDGDGLYEIILWGFGGLGVLIDSLYSKVEEIDSHVEEKSTVDELNMLISLLETQTEAVRSRLEELDQQYLGPLKQKQKLFNQKEHMGVPA